MSREIRPGRPSDSRTVFQRTIRRTLTRTTTVTLLPLVILCGLGLSAAPHSQPQNGQEVLTNASIIKMVQAHLSTEVIVEKTRTHPLFLSVRSAQLTGHCASRFGLIFDERDFA